MNKPQKFFRIKIAAITFAQYTIKITITEAVEIGDGEWSEVMIGQQMYTESEAGASVGVMMDSILEDYLDYDPVFMVYRDRSEDVVADAPAIPSSVWKGRFSKVA